jgi:GT2 family glycosyltransferase
MGNLSIVIITRNTSDLLRNLLKSVEADATLKHFLRDIIVIDNNSTDGTDSMVQREFPRVLLLKNDRNKGFATAANMGISQSKGDYILFLNSDTLLIEGEVTAMIQMMEENPGVGICGPQLVYEDMRPQRSFAHIPSLLFEIVPLSLFGLLFPGRYSTKSPRQTSPSSDALRHAPGAMSFFDVPSLIGAAIIVRRELLENLGGFDQQFFFFLEETDLCIRARERGARVVFLPHVRMIHLQGRTVRKNWVQGRIQYNISLYKFIKKHHSMLYYQIFQGIRSLKSLFVPLVLSALFPLLLHKRTRRTYAYYLNLLLWHLKGCPEEGGLLLSSQG